MKVAALLALFLITGVQVAYFASRWHFARLDGVPRRTRAMAVACLSSVIALGAALYVLLVEAGR